MTKKTIKNLLFPWGVSLFLLFTLLFPLRGTDLYGVNVHVQPNTVLSMAKQAGIRWMRVDFSWADIEPSQGYYNYQEIDRVVAFAVSNNMAILANLGDTPAWANGDQGKNVLPTNVQYWRNFVNRMVTRYKGRVSYWGIWNEPNLEDFLRGSADDYVTKVLIPASEVIRGNDSSAKIVAPDISYLTSPERRWDSFLKTVLEKGKNYLDIVSIHAYDSSGAEAIMNKIEKGYNIIYPAVTKVMSDYGCADKELWLTETGWSTTSVSEDTQASNYLDLLTKILNSTSVDKVFFYEIQDVPNVSGYGILNADTSPKKSYYTYKNFIQNEASYIDDGSGEDDDKEDDKKPCLFRTLHSEGEVVLPKARSFRNSFLENQGARGKGLISLYYRFSAVALPRLQGRPELKRQMRRCFALWTQTLVPLQGEGVSINDLRLDGKLYEETDRLLQNWIDGESSPSWKGLLIRGRSLLALYRGERIVRLMNEGEGLLRLLSFEKFIAKGGNNG